MKMPFLQFLGLDFLGASVYALAYGGAGFIFRDFVATIARGFRTAGQAVEIVVVIAAGAFTAYRISLYWKHRADASLHGYRSQNWQQSCKVNMQKGFRWSMCAATVTTILMPNVFEGRFDWSRITCRRKSKHFPGAKTSTCTALDRARQLAPVWRICCGSKDLKRLSSLAA
jgi:hypothetical protein